MHIYKSSTMIKLKDGFSGERALVLPQSIIQEMEKDALSSILHITDIGYYPKALHHFRERKEPICQFVFIYCIEGDRMVPLRRPGIYGHSQPVFYPASRSHACLRFG